MTHMRAGGQSLQALKDGNARYTEGVARRFDLVRRRAEIAGGQQPHATILSCSDSRVVPEYIFDSQPGELFVVRTAGNVADAVAQGSMEYGTGQLNTPLLLVMGHSRCGAVMAACDSRGLFAENPVGAILQRIDPSARKADYTRLDDAILHNVESVIEDIRSTSVVIRTLERENRLLILGGIYDLDSGLVQFL